MPSCYREVIPSEVEALVDLPTIRVGPDDILRKDFLHRLIAKIRPHLGKAA